MARPIVLFLGGARSGKSELAERAVAEWELPVTYLATGWTPDGTDSGWAARVAAHRLRRSPGWTTVEVGVDLPEVLLEIEGAALVDSLGTWVGGVPGFAVDPGALCDALVARDGPTVVVSDEVGFGVTPPTPAGNAFRDALGDLNRAVSAVADEAWLVVAGRRLELR